MKILCVIPSRIGSNRLRRKPLALIRGKPMIQLVYENAAMCSLLDKVVVATDSEEVASVIGNCGGNVEFMPQDFNTGSDRVAEIALKYPEMTVVINLQGDEPFIRATMLEQMVVPFLVGKKPEVVTLAQELDKERDYYNPDVVKVITDLNDNAMYFSRSPIPYFKNADFVAKKTPIYHHIGVYAFLRKFLLHYTALQQTPLEVAESLEQLRVLENGYKIKVALVKGKTLEINTKEDLKKAQLFNDSII